MEWGKIWLFPVQKYNYKFNTSVKIHISIWFIKIYLSYSKKTKKTLVTSPQMQFLKNHSAWETDFMSVCRPSSQAWNDFLFSWFLCAFIMYGASERVYVRCWVVKIYIWKWLCEDFPTFWYWFFSKATYF